MTHEDIEMEPREPSQVKPKVLVVGAAGTNAALCAALIAAGTQVITAEEMEAGDPLARLRSLADAYRRPEQAPVSAADWQDLPRKGKKGKWRRW